MFQRFFADVGAEIAAFGQRIRQMIWRPVFDVKLIQPEIDTGLIAGERQDICIVEISLPDNYSEDHEEQIEFPRPSVYNLKRNAGLADIDIKLLDNVLTYNRRKMKIVVFGYLTETGNYLVYPQFPETSQIRFVGRNNAEFVVQPSSPESLTMFKIHSVSGDGLNFYRGGKAEVFVKVKDRHANTVEDIELDVESSHVALDSCRFDSKSGCHVVIVDCKKEGRASLSFTSGPLRTDVELTIIPAPLYPANCRALRTETEGCVLAGQIVKWQLQLYDICNHPFLLKDDSLTSRPIVPKIDDEFRVDDKTSRLKEENSLKFTMSDNHVCFVEWQPLIAGNRSIAVSINGVVIGKRLLHVNVEPGPLVDVIVEFGNSSICYPTDVVTLKGLDVFSNNVSLNPLQWHLESLSGEGLHQKFTESNDGKKLECHYSFDLPGRYMIQVKSTDDALSHINIPDSFSQEIASPLYADRCDVRMCKEPPIFENSLRIGVLLSPYTGVTNRCLEHVVRFLEIKVDDKSIESGDIDRHRSYSKNSWEIGIRNLLYGQGKTFEVLYCGERLGKKLQVDLEGVRPFEIIDYIEVLESLNKIRCKGVPIGTLIGADKANIHNINRVLAIDGAALLTIDKINKDEQQPHTVYFDLDGLDDESVDDVYNLLGFLVEGFHHFRKQAHRFGDKRRKWKEKEKQARSDEREEISMNRYRPPSECKIIKEKYGELMNECHEKASNAILEFYNCDRHESEIDLHGQQVANEQNLENLRVELLENVKRLRIENIIQSIREKTDEAIRHLRHRMEKFDHEKAQLEERDWLEIIVGAGHHSDDRRQKIRPKVEQFLNGMNYEYIECNPGSLLITFTEYSGQEPCMANFLCQNIVNNHGKKCHRSWESITSWKGMFQKCYSCDRKGIASRCYPFKLRSPSTSRSYRRRVETDVTRRDHRRLCQMCIELGRDCSAAR